MPYKAKAVRSFNLRLDTGIYEVLRRHAFERGVSLNSMLTDVLLLWCIAATDQTDPFFSPKNLGVKLPPPPEERYEGYLNSLVFTLPKEPDAKG